MRDHWLEERDVSPPPGHRWLAEYTPQEVATIQRLAWDGDEHDSHHNLKRHYAGVAHTKPIRIHALLDRPIEHTKGDRHGFCSNQLRADENFAALCSERLGRTPARQALNAQARQRIKERQNEDLDKVRQKYEERMKAQRAAEQRMFSPARPGSREAKVEREQAEAMASRPHSARRASAELAYARWQRQFADGKAHTERLTGKYVHSLDDVERIERVPSERRTVGRHRLTEGKANAFFSSSLRSHGSPSSSPRLHPRNMIVPSGHGSSSGRAPWRSARRGDSVTL